VIAGTARPSSARSVDAQADYIDALQTRLDAQDEAIAELRATMEALAATVETLRK
jgi:hypothetical protein